MTAIGALLLSVLCMRGQAGGEAATPAKDKRTITTSGSATVTVKPDAARVFFGVQSVGPTIQEARKENNLRARKLIDALRALDIPNLKLKTANINVEIISERQQDELRLPKVLGYRVTNSFSALVKDKDAVRLGANASLLLDTALVNGANFIQQIVAFREDEAGIRREGLSKAVEAALANAEAIATGARARVRETFMLQGEPEYTYGPGQCGLTNRIVVAGDPAVGDTPVIVGDLEVTIHVKLSCTY
jgi:uncharacterized protein YggE